MYKKIQNRQAELTDFNQPLGFKINPLNRWVIKASTIHWDAIEERYSSLFPSHTGPAAKPLRMALGSLLIQKKYDLSDRELVEEIKENPYLQFFIGLPGYRDEAPFVPSLLVEFRKRLNEKVLAEINEMIIEFNKPTDPPPKGGKPSENWRKPFCAKKQFWNFQGTIAEQRQGSCCLFRIITGIIVRRLNSHLLSIHYLRIHLCHKMDVGGERYEDYADVSVEVD